MLNLMIAAIAQAGGVIFSRVALIDNHISVKNYTVGSFVFLSFFTIIAYALFGWIDGYQTQLNVKTLPLFAGLIVTGLVAHALYMQGVKRKTVAAIESLVILAPLLTILLTTIFHQENINRGTLVAVTTGTIILLWANRESKSRVPFDTGTWFLIASTVFSALENIVVAKLLSEGAFTPLSLYTYRTVVITFIFLAFFRPNLALMKPYNLAFLAGAALLGFFTMVFRFYALRDLGIIHTSIILMLVPTIVYMLSFSLLKQKLRYRQNVATISLVGITAYLYLTTFL